MKNICGYILVMKENTDREILEKYIDVQTSCNMNISF